MYRDKEARKAELKRALIQWLKGLIAPGIIALVILAAVLIILNYHNAEDEEEIIRVNGWEGDIEEVVLENNDLRFVMDPSTTQFSLEVKSSGKVWNSNPEGGSSDPLALTAEKGRLQSTLALTWSTQAGVDAPYNNYNYSIEKSVYDIELGEDYVKVYYSIGDTEKEYIIPRVITDEDFNKWLGLMDQQEAGTVKEYYKKYDINNLGKKDDKEQLLANYPILADEVIWVLRDTTKDHLKKRFEEYFEAVGYTMEDYQADKELNFAESAFDKPIFNVNVIYRLDGDDLLVEIPLSEIEYRSDYPLYDLSVLPFFGAGSREDQGFMLVPEGGGALINFNNGKNMQNSYYANMYGWDMALNREALVHSTRNYFNVYGISQGDDSFICILEDGAAYASISADISGRNNSYNYVYAVYSIALREKYNVGAIANSSIYVYLPELPDGSLVQRYSFIDSGSYTDMAKDYQEYLLNKYEGYMTLNDDTEAPVAVEIMGAVDKVKQVLGIPMSRPLKLTTFKEAQEIIAQLKGDGLNNMAVKLTGWANGGVQQKLLSRVKTVSALGSKKDLKNMIDSATELGVDVYLDGVTQYAYDSNIFNGFFVFTDSARFISKEKAELYEYNPVSFGKSEWKGSFYLVHPDIEAEMTQKLSETAQKYGTGISFRENGMDLSADYYRKDMRSRQDVLEQQVGEFKELADSGQKIMINMGNDYAAPYCDLITNMDLQGSEYTIIDTYVPFYQMALHGYVNYTGEPLNLAGETEDELLRSAEYGAGLQFNLMKETAFILQKTLYTEYYGSDYAAWHDRLVDIYTRYNAELGHTFNQRMMGHEQITADLSCTMYEDGTKVYVNYGYVDLTAQDGTVVPARDYKVVR
ncbi:MAG: hypothetical protein K2K19_09460 [Acetatifactor sp.]|nr:hypothetical protein [Acetatifactor sp.]